MHIDRDHLNWNNYGNYAGLIIERKSKRLGSIPESRIKYQNGFVIWERVLTGNSQGKIYFLFVRYSCLKKSKNHKNQLFFLVRQIFYKIATQKIRELMLYLV